MISFILNQQQITKLFFKVFFLVSLPKSNFLHKVTNAGVSYFKFEDMIEECNNSKETVHQIN